MPVDAGAAIPPPVGLIAVIYPNGQHIRLPRNYVRRQIVLHTDKSIRTRTHPLAIQPYVAVAVDALELDQQPLPVGKIRRRERFAVTTHTAGHEARVDAAGHFLIEGSFNAPIVR